ncbi:hypothetical protein DYB31_002041 [Aphanomyces astaci]|uniref:RRM domain-containing protein n=1 Tax=Aphanomyces astaci TaxID=112090 RepID=A0A397F5B0_APHAT|nr:hypothetical protein DYB31_002041 [Aphanomyces astaci]
MLSTSSGAAPSTSMLPRNLPPPYPDRRLPPRHPSCDDRSMASNDDQNKVIVVGLCKSVDDAGLKDMFDRFGAVAEAKVIVDEKKHTSCGYGFVTYTNAASKHKAIKHMHQKCVDGVVLTVKNAGVNADRPSISGGLGNCRTKTPKEGHTIKVEHGLGRTHDENDDDTVSETGHVYSENTRPNVATSVRSEGDDHHHRGHTQDGADEGTAPCCPEDGERATRLEKDRMRKTKYRKQKMAQVDALKYEAQILEQRLEKLKADHSNHHKKARHSQGRGAMWQQICVAEAANKRDSLTEQQNLYRSLEEHLHLAVSLKRKMTSANDVPLCFDPRGRPSEAYYAQHSLARHPVARVQSVHAMLDAQFHQLADTFVAKLPTADHDGTFGLVLHHDEISFLETIKFGVVYGRVVDVADLVWRHLLASRGPGTKVEMLDDDACFIQALQHNDSVPTDTPHHYIAKRYVEPGRQVLQSRNVLHDALCPQQNPFKDHMVSWVVVEDMSHPQDKYPTTCIRGYSQTCLRSTRSASVQEYSVYMNDLTKRNDSLNSDLHRRFRCLVLN